MKNINTCEIKKIDANTNRSRYGAKVKSVVYAKSNLVDIADDFLNEHKIWALPFKCKTWSRVGGLAARATAKIISEKVGYKASFSRTAGCSCGCSPGYVFHAPVTSEYYNKRLNIEIVADEGKVRAAIARGTIDLPLEIKLHA